MGKKKDDNKVLKMPTLADETRICGFDVDDGEKKLLGYARCLSDYCRGNIESNLADVDDEDEYTEEEFNDIICGDCVFYSILGECMFRKGHRPSEWDVPNNQGLTKAELVRNFAAELMTRADFADRIGAEQWTMDFKMNSNGTVPECRLIPLDKDGREMMKSGRLAQSETDDKEQ